MEPEGCRTLGIGDLKLTSVRPAVAVLALAVVASLAVWRSAPPLPRGADAPLAEFSAARAEEVLRRLVGEEAPRPLGSAEHQRYQERLVAELSRLALAPSLERGVACSPDGSCAQLTNIVAELPGTLPGPAVLLAAHYDSVAAGPGVSDNAAGVACALEVARALQSLPRRNPVLLLFDDGEEVGMLGPSSLASSGRGRLAMW
jgi:acetylornithine deacetylase/succinyl-diaminopimelate desuccinylase-like protein